MLRCLLAVPLFALAAAPVGQGQTALPHPSDPLTPVRAHLPAAKPVPPRNLVVPQKDTSSQASKPTPYFTPPFVPLRLPPH